MTNPVKIRNRAAIVLAMAIGAVVTACLLPDAGQRFTPQVVLGVGGGTVAIFAFVWMLVRHGDARRYRRLLRGEGVLARWTIGPARWQRFKKESLGWDALGNLDHNVLDLDQAAPDAGIEIIVSGDAVLIGTDYHSLEKNVTVNVYAGWMEFDQDASGPDGPSLRQVLRFPLAIESEGDGELIQRSYRQAYEEAASNPRLKIYAALIVLVGIPLITVVIMLVSRVVRSRS